MEEKWIIIAVIVFAIILAFFSGWLIGKKPVKCKDYDGTLLIGEEDDREQFKFIFSTELEDLREKHELVMQIRKDNTQNLQSL